MCLCVTLRLQSYSFRFVLAIGFCRFSERFRQLRLFNRVRFGIIYWSSEHYPLLRQRGKTTKTARIPIKTVPDIAPVTQWSEEHITYVIFLLHASAEAPTAACAIIYLSLIKQAVFIVVPIILLNTDYIWNANLLLSTLFAIKVCYFCRRVLWQC